MIFEFGRGAGAEKLRAIPIEQRHIVRPLVASDWQLQCQTPCTTRNLQWQLTSFWPVFSSHRCPAPKIENHRCSRLPQRPTSQPDPSCHRNKHRRRNRDPCLDATPAARHLCPEFGEVSKARAAGAEMVEPRIGFRQRQFVKGDVSENCRTRAPDPLWVRKLT